RGRDAIAAQTKRSFTEHKGLSIKLTNKTIRFVKPDVALQDGIVTMTAQDKPSDTGPFMSVWTKIDGKWLLASVRDLPDEAPAAGTNYSALKQLEWLVGEWTGEEKETSVAMSIRWDKNQNFLVIEQAIKMKGDNSLTLTQIIGWDPSNQQIRSWVFDSRGGFGEAFWTRQGNEWELQVAGVLSDGRTTSSLNSWKYIDDHTAEWQSTQRQVDSQPMPDVKMKYVKKDAKK
ncbi:MAG TPA: nuclear transport factor 2 family protein, partial [Gemmataceae bacterium]